MSVLASGSGTNLQALLDRFHAEGDGAARIVRVLASRPGIGALDRAARADVEGLVVPRGETEAAALAGALEEAGTELVVLAGWLRLVPASVVRAWRGRMINVHPALLPAFGGEGMYGLHVHRAVLEAGARVTGVTVHFVDEAYDRGPIIAQWPVPVLSGDDPEGLARRVLSTEHRLLPRVVSELARGRVELEPSGRVRWHGPMEPGDRFVLVGEEGGGAALASRRPPPSA